MLEYVIGTSAIQRYVAADGLTISPLLAEFTDAGCTVIAPATCLSEAYWQADGDDEPMLGILNSLPPIRVDPLEAGDATSVGSMARFLGSLGMAHACLLASSGRLTLLTAEPILASKMLNSAQIWEV